MQLRNELKSFIKASDNFTGWVQESSLSDKESNNSGSDDFDCWDHNKDGEDDTCSADFNGNNKVDAYLWDEDYDGDYDWISFDENENTIPELYVLISDSHDDYNYDLYYLTIMR